MCLSVGIRVAIGELYVRVIFMYKIKARFGELLLKCGSNGGARSLASSIGCLGSTGTVTNYGKHPPTFHQWCWLRKQIQYTEHQSD